MRKAFNYLRSMRFGLLLLGLIGLCSVVGTVIPQGREIAWYAQTYPSFHGTILLLGLNRVFESWYFIVLLVLLCLNLSLCSLLRIRRVVKASKGETERAARLPDAVRLSPEGVEKLREYMNAMRCKSETLDGATVYRKHAVGRYGTFITHLSILLTVVFGALALYTPTVVDRDCMPGESVFLDDGTEIHVHDFRIADETGRLDYQSHVQVTLPDGRQSEIAELKVNHPFSFGAYKLFQQTFGTTGSVTVTDLDGSEFISYINRGDVLMIDDQNRLLIDTLYPDYAMSPDGEIVFDTVTTGAYPNPIYTGLIIADGERTPFYALPGQALTLSGARFAFNAPVDYPGIRVKHVSPLVNALLVASFTLMIAGLYITFFYEPVLVKVSDTGYTVAGPKPERMRVELGEELREYEEKVESEK